MAHQSRIEGIVTAFNAAHDQLIASLEQLSEAAAAQRPQDGGWTPAQIGWHVAATNDLLGQIITGEAPLAQPAAEGFVENPAVFEGLPAKVQTFPQLVPPAGVTRDEALGRLRESAGPLAAKLRAMSQERAAGHCVAFPFGTLSLYQLGEFAAGHVARHHGQLQRAIAAV